jgi:orotate phosphoribosyltransferase-like protein
MISFRNRKYCSFILDQKNHDILIEWKKASRHVTKPLPGDIFLRLETVVAEYFCGFDILTVPAPSFHTYENYPIWNIALIIGPLAGVEVAILFPNKSGKLKMSTFGSCLKTVQDIECPSEKFILILDDIYTTGHTMRVSCEAIAKKGSFPVGLALG